MPILDKQHGHQGVPKIARGKSSRYVGVTKQTRSRLWYADIRVNGVRYNLGGHDTENEAALAYNRKAFELLGKEAKLNSITEITSCPDLAPTITA